MSDRAANAGESNSVPAAPRAAVEFSSQVRRFVLFALLGIGLGLVATLLVMRQWHFDPTPTLTPAIFYRQQDHSKGNKIPSYDIEVNVMGPQAAVYRVEVREGEAIAAWRNGKPLTSQRTFGTWSIPGMFATISRDVEAIERSVQEHKQPPLILRAAFHPEYNFPEHYRRIDNGSQKGGDSITVAWDVTLFRLVKQ